MSQGDDNSALQHAINSCTLDWQDQHMFLWIELNVFPCNHSGIWECDNFENQHVVCDNSHLWSCYGSSVLCIRHWLMFIRFNYVINLTYGQPANNNIHGCFTNSSGNDQWIRWNFSLSQCREIGRIKTTFISFVYNWTVIKVTRNSTVNFKIWIPAFWK